MALVSISEAARLTGKNRRTIQRHIDAGKLSKVTDSATGLHKLDTSELLRVYGKLENQELDSDKNITMSHNVADENNKNLQIENERLRLELAYTKELLTEKDKRNEDLKQAMVLLEHSKAKKRWWIF